jgi:beta-mannosidase
MQLVESEARAIVRSLRHHASLALWCGGNEFSPRRNALLVTTLRRAVDEEDAAHPFLPASPAMGDSHYWQVWHRFRAPAVYREDTSPFASEFGLQAPPAADTLRRFLPADDLWPPGSAWAYHGGGIEKLWRYARPFLPDGQPDLEHFVQASQRAQVYGLQIAIEHYRRRKALGCGGLLLWQLNEPWPAISWALLDFYGQPKPSYDAVKRLYNPILISIEYPLRAYHAGDCLQAGVWMINDRARSYFGCQAQVMLWDRDSRRLEQIDFEADLPADSAQMVHRLNWTLPPSSGWLLTCQVAYEGETLACNSYDLAVHDGIQPTWRQRLRSWLVALVSSA